MLGTLVSQTVLNIVALIILGAIMFSSVDFFSGHQNALLFAAIAPAVLLVFVLLAPIVLRYGPGGTRFNRARQRDASRSRRALGRVRAGLTVFRKPRLGADRRSSPARRLGAAVRLLLLPAVRARPRSTRPASPRPPAVLFAVNITAVLPATPANLGVFQAACADGAAHRLARRLRAPASPTA